jgi:hypothetical protein
VYVVLHVGMSFHSLSAESTITLTRALRSSRERMANAIDMLKMRRYVEQIKALESLLTVVKNNT